MRILLVNPPPPAIGSRIPHEHLRLCQGLPCASVKQCLVSPGRCHPCRLIVCNERALGAAL